MKKTVTIIILFAFIFAFVLLFFQTTLFASSGGTSILDPDDYNTSLQYGDASYIFSKGGNLLRILRNIAAIVAIVTITIIGVRYILGSTEQRATYKETMLPVVIGCILVGGLASILTLIQSIF